MRMILILFTLLFNFSHAWARFQLIYDIDYTITHEVPKGTPGAIFLEFDQKYYRVNNWVLEGIENLRHQKISFSFFSGGQKKRNIELLKKIRLPQTNQSLYDIASNIFSRSDLEATSITEGRFGERFKKNLKRQGFDLRRTLLIDDYFNFVPQGQQKNLLWVGKTYHYYDTYLQAQEAIRKGLPYVPPSYDEWFIAKNKFKWINELLLDAFENTSEENILSFIHKFKESYIPYSEHLNQNYKALYGPLKQVPSICFRNFKYFKIKD